MSKSLHSGPIRLLVYGPHALPHLHSHVLHSTAIVQSNNSVCLCCVFEPELLLCLPVLIASRTFNGAPLFGESRPNITISNVSPSAEGIYTCTVRVGSEVHLHSFDLQVLVAPLITVPPTSVIGRVGQAVTLTCQTDLSIHPPPTVSWHHGDPTFGTTPVKLSPSVLLQNNNQSLTFRMIQAHQLGVYRCVVANAIGKNQAEAKIDPRKSPASHSFASTQSTGHLVLHIPCNGLCQLFCSPPPSHAYVHYGGVTVQPGSGVCHVFFSR